MSAFTGFVEGFNSERDKQYAENLDKERKNREMADRVFTTLLNSGDKDMQMLAMQGLAAPIGRKKGLAGYLGGVQNDANPIYQHILDRANELVPDTSSAPKPAVASGSAAMSTNQMTRPGSAPPTMPPSPAAPTTPGMSLPPEQPPVTTGGSGVSAAMPPDLQMQGPQGIPLPPPEPPQMKWKRRGTGVPTAEEIAEATAHATLQGRMQAATEGIQSVGGSPADQRRAVLGIAGAPESQNDFVQGTMGVKGADGKIHPVSFDRTTGHYAFADGTPVPGNAEFVKMTGGASGAGVPRTTKVEDPNSSTGWSRVFYDTTTGQELYRHDDTPFVPPPAFTGVAPGVDAAGNPTTFGIPRGGGAPRPLMPSASTQPTAEQSDAQALLTEVDKAITDAETPKVLGLPKKPLTPQQKDAIVKQRAAAGQLPYTTYLEVQRAARQQRRPSATPTTATPPATPGTSGSALSMADQIRADLLSKQPAGAATPPPPPPPSPPPSIRK